MAAMQGRHGRLMMALVAGAALAAPLHAMAEQTPADNGATVGEVVVTSQKREERLLDVPISLTAVTASTIANRGITSLKEMQYAVPGLNITEYGTGIEKIEIRGVSQQLGSPTVGVYLDEVPLNAISAGGGVDIRLIDMERVEVLRGPQPTLYGEDSMGGTIRYITASPDLHHFFGHVEGEIGSVKDGGSEGRLDGWINLPVIDGKLGIRVAGGHEQLGGWIDSSVSGQHNVNDTNIDTFRAKVLFKPTDRLTISLLGLTQHSGQGYQNYSQADGTTGALIPQPLKIRYSLANLVVSYDAGPVTLLSTTGYLNLRGSSTYDQTAYLLPIFSFLFPPNETLGVTEIGHMRKWNEEVRLTSNGAGPLRYSAGMVFTDIKSDSVNIDVDAPVPSPFPIFESAGSAESRSWAVFGDIGYDITPNLSIDVGGRYFRDHQSNSAPKSANFSTFNPRIDITYKTSADGIVYFNAARGFRSGGFNSFVFPGINPTYNPESLYSYELGTKQQFMNRRLVVEGSIFFTQWTNIQALSPVFIFPVVKNEGKADGPGADLAVTARVTDELSLSGTIAYTGVKYRTNSLDRRSGDPLDLVAPWTWSLAADWRHPVTDDAKLVAHVDYGHTAASSVILRNFGTPVNPVDARDVVNGKLGIDCGRFEAYVYGYNLTNDYGTVYPAVGTTVEPIRPRPRTIGIGVKADF